MTMDSLFLGPIDTESLLRRAFRTITRGAPTFMVVVGILMLPSLIVSFADVLDPATDDDPIAWLRQILGGALVMLAGLVAQAAVVFGVFRQLRGESATAGQCFRMALRRFLPVLGASLLIGMTMLGTMFIAFIPLVLLVAVFPPLMLLGLIGIAIAIYVYCGLFLTIPVVVSEDVGPLRALSRSWSLTTDYRGPIFFILLLTGLCNIILGVIILLMSGELGDFSLSLTLQLAFVPLQYFGQVILVAFAAVVAGVAYHDLRAAKEGLDEDALAAIFD